MSKSTGEKVGASRSPHGERGLKYSSFYMCSYKYTRRSPHGERGLKFPVGHTTIVLRMSLSSRRAWIEISAGLASKPYALVALLTESVD